MTTSIHLPRELTSPSDAFTSASGSIGLHWWHYDFKARRIIVSPSLLKVLGYTPESFDYSLESIYEKVHPDDLKRNEERINNVINGEMDLYEIEYRLMDTEGEWQWYYNRGTVNQRDDEGKPLGLGGFPSIFPVDSGTCFPWWRRRTSLSIYSEIPLKLLSLLNYLKERQVMCWMPIRPLLIYSIWVRRH